MSRIGVLETAEWYANDNTTSIKAIFSILAQLETADPNNFMYSTFVNEDSFKATLQYFANLQNLRIYLCWIPWSRSRR